MLDLCCWVLPICRDLEIFMMMYIDLMTCIFWRCMTYIRCDCWWILYMHVVWILMWRHGVYFLNIYIIRVYYRFNRNRALQWLLRTMRLESHGGGETAWWWWGDLVMAGSSCMRSKIDTVGCHAGGHRPTNGTSVVGELGWERFAEEGELVRAAQKTWEERWLRGTEKGKIIIKKIWYFWTVLYYGVCIVFVFMCSFLLLIIVITIYIYLWNFLNLFYISQKIH